VGPHVQPGGGHREAPLGSSGDIEVFSPEEVWALVQAAGSEQDAAIFLTAAFTELRRGELLALHRRDVDFTGSVVRVRASHHEGVLSTPKSGKVRSVPLAPDVASALAKLADHSECTADDDLVFVGEGGSYLDGSALRRRYDAAIARAGLRRLRFHEYADVRVMPMSVSRGCSERVLVSRGRHIQSASRKARSVSVGRNESGFFELGDLFADGDQAGVEVDVIAPEPDGFTDPHAAHREQPEQRLVARGLQRRREPVRGPKQPADVGV
jgi:hypothetical protein